jgi:hypothetical protein
MSSPYPKNKSTALPLPFEGGIGEVAITQSRKCHKCGVTKSLLEYYLDRDGHQIRCKICASHDDKVRTKVKKFAPPISATCDCCGRIPHKFVLDHDHATESFRGWLCERCNIGLGKFGDNLDGLMKAVEYLKRTAKE